jgi:hypothetical protein
LSTNATSSLTWNRLVRGVNRKVKSNHSDSGQTAYALSELPGGGYSSDPVPGMTPGAAPGGFHVGSTGPGSNGLGRGTRRVRFGAVVAPSARAEAQGGVEVTQVVPGAPATAMRSVDDGQVRRLVAGMHVITHINDQPIHSYQDFARAIDNSPTQMRVRVYNLEKGTLREYEATLRD